jgi:chemotaxis protein methyltransferase CheR
MSSSSAPIGTINSEFVGLIEKVSNIVHKISGNRLGDKQAYMVETRVKKRMMELGLKSPGDYSKYIDTHFDKETGILVGLITTHHTFFFREFAHFEILKKMLPDLVAAAKKRGDKSLKIWSAACSRGQEVYSLAMFMKYHLSQIDPGMSFKILGTDIDPDSVSIAKNGVYLQQEIKEIPMSYLGDNWAKGSGDIAHFAKVKSTLKSHCEFKVGNLLKIRETVGSEKYDVIFCRNVFIYFESWQIEEMAKELISHLEPTGMFFSGISEPLSPYKIDISTIGPSCYIPKVAGSPNTMPAPMVNMSAPEIVKVLCVDDSPSILTLLKKVLTKENGFEVIATAVNGLDAIEKLKTNKVDIVTLDIHMPEMDGITYLEKNFSKTHPPVVIISSASRADSEVAMKALRYGACDYVEKPALNNLEERGEEIRTKLRSIFQDTHRSSMISSYDNEAQKTYEITNADKKLRIIFASIADMPKIKKLSRELDTKQPPTIVFFEGHGEILEAVAKENSPGFKHAVEYVDKDIFKLEMNKFYFADFKTIYPIVFKKYSSAPCSLLSFGGLSHHAGKMIGEWKGVQLLVEDVNAAANKKHPLSPFSTDIVPATSFAYMSCRYLSTK